MINRKTGFIDHGLDEFVTQLCYMTGLDKYEIGLIQEAWCLDTFDQLSEGFNPNNTTLFKEELGKFGISPKMLRDTMSCLVACANGWFGYDNETGADHIDALTPKEQQIVDEWKQRNAKTWFAINALNAYLIKLTLYYNGISPKPISEQGCAVLQIQLDNAIACLKSPELAVHCGTPVFLSVLPNPELGLDTLLQRNYFKAVTNIESNIEERAHFKERRMLPVTFELTLDKGITTITATKVYDHGNHWTVNLTL